MRLFLGCMLAVALALSPAVAGANDSRSGGSGEAKASDANSGSASEPPAKTDVSAEPAANANAAAAGAASEPVASSSGSGAASAAARIPAAPARRHPRLATPFRVTPAVPPRLCVLHPGRIHGFYRRIPQSQRGRRHRIELCGHSLRVRSRSDGRERSSPIPHQPVESRE